jgi:hypothetical protein
MQEVTITIQRTTGGDGLWNESAQAYEAKGSDGKNYTISGDDFAEDLKDYQQTYVEQGMDEDVAYDKAKEELLSYSWTPDMDCVLPLE